MYEKEWLKEQKEMYWENKEQVQSLQNCAGVCDNYITYTYLSVYNCKQMKTYTYFLFVPGITGREEVWEKEGTDPWYRTYDFSLYDNKPYIYMKDGYMYCSDVFLQTVNSFAVYRYEDFTLKEPEYVYISSVKPNLRSIERNGPRDITLAFANPYEGTFLRDDMFKDIILQTKTNGTFFSVKIN